MEKQRPSEPASARNLIIFTVIVLALPWIGWAVDRMSGAVNQQESLGWLLFIASPLAAVVLLRLFGGDGWKDFGLKPAFKGNGKWYAFALLFHPLVAILLLFLGWLTGSIGVTGFSGPGFVLIGQAILISLVPTLVKNVFEEFAWRGYLTPKINILTQHTLAGHLLVGLIWFAWHLPYYLVLLSREEIATFSALPLGAFLLLTFLSLLAAAILYGEIRLRTGSVWPVVVLHVVGNVTIAALITESFFNVRPGWDWFLSPAWSSLGSVVLFAGAGLWLYRLRTKSEPLPAAGAVSGPMVKER